YGSHNSQSDNRAEALGQGFACRGQNRCRPAAISQILGVTAVGYNTCPEEPPGCLRAESQGAKQVCDRSRRSHFFSDVEVFVFIAPSINLCNSSGVASFVPI